MRKTTPSCPGENCEECHCMLIMRADTLPRADAAIPSKVLRSKSLTVGFWLTWGLIALVFASLPAIFWSPYLSSTFHSDNSCALMNSVSAANGSEGGGRAQALFNILPMTNSMSYDSVKAVDLSFNIIVGRGGQALILWVSYHVYRACLVRIMETQAVSHAFYLSLALGPPSVFSLWQITVQILSARWKFKTLLTWMFVSFIWTLMWPVLVDGMAGYVSVGEPYIRDVTNHFLPKNDFFNGNILWSLEYEYGSKYPSPCPRSNYEIYDMRVSKLNGSYFIVQPYYYNSTLYTRPANIYVNETFYNVICTRRPSHHDTTPANHYR